MANYLVTGAAGFIASRVAEMLLDEGHTVVGLDNLNDAYDVRMKHYRLERLKKRQNFVFHLLDIAQRQVLEAIPSMEYAAVINLAARAGVRQSLTNPWVYIDANITGTLNMLELCRQRSVPKFLLASTSTVYGAEAPIPTSEEASTDHPLQTYAASKKGAEALAYAYHYLYSIDVTVVRYFTVYGPAGRPDMSMFRFVQWINEGRPVRVYGDGKQSRGFTYVDDIARGTILALKPLGYEAINLGGHESICINALIARLERLIGKRAQVEHLPPIPAELAANLADVSKARRLLGWEPQVNLDQGLENIVQWYCQERAWASQVATD